MAEVALHTGWTFDEIRAHNLDEIAAVRHAINEKRKAEQGNGQ